MGEDLPVCGFSALRFLEAGNTSRPHHDPLRDQKNRGIQQSRFPKYSLCQRIAHEAGVGTDRGILIYAFFSGVKSSVQKPGKQKRYHLSQNRHQKHHKEGTPEPRLHFPGKCLDDVAGKDGIQDDVRETFFPFQGNDSCFSHEKSRSHQKHHHPHEPVKF